MRLNRTSSPATEPITLAEAKLHLRVDFDDDALITSLAIAAREVIESRLGQSLITQTWELILDYFPSAGGYYNPQIRQVWSSLGGFPSGTGPYPGMLANAGGMIPLYMPPIQSVTSVQYYDFTGTLQTVDPSVYIVSTGFPGRIEPNYSKVWPIARPTVDSVLITFVAGYGSSASSVPEAVKAAMKLMIGNWYENREAVGTGSYMEIPMAVTALLASLEHGGYS